MSDWDTSDNETPIINIKPASNWNDEDADDDIKESWEESEEEQPKGVIKPKKKIPLAQKIAEREAKERDNKLKELAADLTSEGLRQRREEQKRLQEEADLQNVADLFGGVALQESEKTQPLNENSTESKMIAFSENPLKTKEDFDQYEKLLSEMILNGKASKLYPGFIENLVRTICEPLKDVELRKITSVLTAVANEKQRAAKAATKGKSKGSKKTNVRVDADITSATSAAKAGVFDNYEEFDDFM